MLTSFPPNRFSLSYSEVRAGALCGGEWEGSSAFRKIEHMGLFWGESVQGSVRACTRKGEICSRVKTQLGYDSYWEGQYNLRRAHEFKKLDLVFDKNWLLYVLHSSSFYKVNCSMWPVHAEQKSMKVFPGGSVGKEFTFSAGDTGSIPGLGRSLEKEMATLSSILAWVIPWSEETGGLQSMGWQELGTSN